MAWLLILGLVVLVVGLVLLSAKQAPTPEARRHRDPGGPGVWIDDYGAAGSLPLDRFGYSSDAAGSPGSDHADFDPGGGSGGGGGASGSWDDGGDGGGDDGGGGD